MAKRIYREITNDGTKWKMSLAKQNGLNPNYGKPRDEITKAKIAKSMRDYWNSVPSINDNNDDKNKPE
ncbi:hypothetical protein D0T84_21650 [Dysgonomonas sp. 521]|uniref:NUMOD3 domain-containing DNA-binding protein n=1 Tax=Dysgonomonas sp. 521 TaxID=2302932 RepID=UPI0013D477CA|nr:NUMOD3 domain-containing DNA-binding protein [Dysgonomonas sp. 521]NDV97476.1 hypothetical protein [Dysgonomonas sp. 521]